MPVSQIGDRLVREGVVTEAQLAAALERQRQAGGRLGQNLLALGLLTEEQLARLFRKDKPTPRSVEDTGLTLPFIADLALKHLGAVIEGRMADLAERLLLPLSIIEKALESLRREKLVEIAGGSGFASVTYTFRMTDAGRRRAAELVEGCSYLGPAPVTLDDYRDMVEFQTVKSALVSPERVAQSFSHLIVNPGILARLGPAASSGRAIFLYGPPGNGKTAIAETVARMMPDTVYVPHAVTVGGQVIALFDPVSHDPVEEPEIQDRDRRWVLVRRPVVTCGGELTLRMLDLDFNPVSRYYEAPLQMKANNGLFIVDDFGRQQAEPRHLLNRWIVPLDRGVDFLSLHTGMKFSIPFDMLVIFSTNMEPRSLVDEAFLRRIPYKIRIDHPSEGEFREIFARVCAAHGIAADPESVDYLLENYYRRFSVPLNACHPRDLVEHVVVSARYAGRPPGLTREALDEAWRNFFVET
jgi:predicted ATPase with chaperone activity